MSPHLWDCGTDRLANSLLPISELTGISLLSYFAVTSNVLTTTESPVAMVYSYSDYLEYSYPFILILHSDRLDDYVTYILGYRPPRLRYE